VRNTYFHVKIKFDQSIHFSGFAEICGFLWIGENQQKIKTLQISLIKFRGPEMNGGSSLQNFRFVGSQSAGIRICSKRNFEATRKLPGPQKKFEGIF
jgi:hypothetical protein